ncbi:MAG: tetratricopeptide repeat protein [Kiloniellaceae bacterium]
MLTDIRGLRLTTDSEAAVTHYNAAIANYFEYRLATGKCLKRALEADPDFVMGHCLRGYLFMLFGSTAFHDRTEKAVAFAEARADRVTRREAVHIAALRAWLMGDLPRTCALWDEILVEHPRDLLALRLQHFNYFWMGRAAALRGGPAGVLDAWDETVPGFGYVLGMLAFGLEECGDYAEAEAKGRQAVEINPEDLWAIHAVAHVLEMQGRLSEGIAWLDYPAEAWADRNPFRGHLWWHAALFPLERGDYDRALALYDRSIRTATSDFYLDIQNAASLLYRLEFQGIDVGDRWAELADHVETRTDDHVLAFTDAHCMMALSAAGRTQTARRLLASLTDFAKTPGNTAAGTMTPVTIPLCEAILAYGEGDYERTVERMLPLRGALACLGGSHAQRDIFAQILLESAIRGGRLKLARVLLSERVSLKPRSYGTWAKYAEVLEGLGEAEAAAAARRRGGELKTA